jgi:serine/threonine protein phosphatase PrpC
MGTTLTALRINNEAVELLHVGDTRCYAFAGGKLNQLSHDHTVMQELIDQGRITPDEAVNHPQRSLLTHALMGDSGFDPVIQLYPVKIGDQFLLCSDGLTSVLSDFEIGKILKKYSGQELVENLVAETKAKGAPDNVTVIWAEIVLEEDASAATLIGAARA